MTEFNEIIKNDSKIQKEISQTNEKYTNESTATQSKMGQIALIESKVFQPAINIMGDTLKIWI